MSIRKASFALMAGLTLAAPLTSAAVHIVAELRARGAAKTQPQSGGISSRADDAASAI